MSPLADAIYEIVKEKHGGVSMVELQDLPGFRGDYEWFLDPYNVVLWAGMSQEAINALRELRDSDLIYPYPTTVLVYLCDGTTLKLPIAKHARRYKNPHWMPIVFNLGPTPEKLRKRASKIKQQPSL